MKNEILCGSACVKYIFDIKEIKDYNLNHRMWWATELALALKENGIKNEIYCFNSSLYSDFISKDVDLNFDGFKYLKKAFDNNISVTEKKLDIRELEIELKENEYIILCVESKVFSNDETMSGGHFVILNKTYGGKVRIINPIKDKYENIKREKEEVVKYGENFGSWRILIKAD